MAITVTQKIDLNEIICDICNKQNKGNTHNNEFYICNNCNKKTLFPSIIYSSWGLNFPREMNLLIFILIEHYNLVDIHNFEK